MTELSKEQLATVEKALISTFGFTWKHWEVEAQVIWNALSAPLVEEVERLKTADTCLRFNHRDDLAELKSLRAENERLKAQLFPPDGGPPADQERDHLAKQCADLLKENERLREALEEIANYSSGDWGEFARAALQSKGEPVE